MATEKMRKQYEPHVVGSLNSWKVRTLAHGAKCAEDIDNFTIAELGFDEEGQRIAKQLSDANNKGYLIASPERRYMGEAIDEFFNGEGDYARIVYLDEGLRFETSAFEGDLKVGQEVAFDPASKKFVAVGEGGARDKFLVVNTEEDLDYTLGAPLVRLEVIK